MQNYINQIDLGSTSPIVRTKRRPSKPDISILKHEQPTAFTNAIDFFGRDGVEGVDMVLLQGYAGTGKSFVTSMIVEHLLTNNFLKRGKTISITAPTHKAVRVLRNMAAYTHHDLEYRTIHSLLGLKPIINQKTGEQEFVPSYQAGNEPAIYNTQYLIIDEISQLHDKLWKYLVPHIHNGDVKCLLVGDPCQIPPVGMTNCIPFTKWGQENYGIQVNELVTIQRQAADDPAIKLSLHLRKNLYDPAPLPRITNGLVDAKGIAYVTRNDSRPFRDALKYMFSSKQFKADADVAKMVCWRNDTVAGYNTLARRLVYGPDAPQFIEGESLIAYAAVTDDEGMILIENNTEMEVLSFKANKRMISKQVTLDYFDVRVLYYVDGRPKELEVYILAEHSVKAFNKFLDSVAALAKSYPFGSASRSKTWRTFYEMKGTFADIRYNYAITGHKCQGSTYRYTFLLEEDINASPDVYLRNRIKYTGVTRHNHGVFILNG